MKKKLNNLLSDPKLNVSDDREKLEALKGLFQALDVEDRKSILKNADKLAKRIIGECMK